MRLDHDYMTNVYCSDLITETRAGMCMLMSKNHMTNELNVT